MPKKNAFSIFVDENFRKMGISRVEAFTALGPKWRSMSSEEKSIYEQKAGKQTSTRSNNLMSNSYSYIRDNFTNSGISYEEMDRQQQEKDEFKRNMINWIDRSVVKATSRDEPKEIFVICMEKHTKTHTGVAVPAEIAIIRFNLIDGIKEARSFIIRNKEKWVKDNAPAYQFKMYDRARNSHSIPVSEEFPFAEGINQVVTEMIDFMSGFSSDNSLSPVFALNRVTETVDHIIEDNMDDIKFALEYLFKNSSTSMKPPLVYDFLELFQKMYKLLMEKVPKIVQPINPAMIREVLKQKIENDRFLLEQCGGDCCRFHYELSETMDFNVEHCPLATAKRMIYIVCDHLSQGVSSDDYSPQLGRHVPTKDGKLGIGSIGSNVTARVVQKALQMSIVKEYVNAISGVKTTAFGSMNGTTSLPLDKDPAIEVARQLKQSLADLKLDETSNEDDTTKYDTINENGPSFPSEEFPSLNRHENEKCGSTKSYNTMNLSGSSRSMPSKRPSRLFAKFGPPSERSTQYKSFD